MSAKLKTGIVLVAVALLGTGFYWWKHGAPRRQALEALNGFQTALNSSAPEALLRVIVSPSSVRDRTAAEQAEFLRKALRDEISPEGLAVLKRDGQFGPLTNIFPAEAEAWSRQAGVSPENCVAFKLERNGLRAEVVLRKPSTFNPQPSAGDPPYRIVRVNNVKQLAETNLVTTETPP